MTQPTPDPRWATVAEAHAYTRGAVSERTLRRWASNGTLTKHRLGPRRIQIDLNELDRLRSQVQPTTTDEHRERTPDAKAS